MNFQDLPLFAGINRPPVDRNVTRTGPQETSQEAARRALGRSGSQRNAIYEEIRMQGGMTCDEVCDYLQMLVQSVTPAINTLARDGWLEDSGKRRLTRSGREAIVWVAIP
jgi:monoamine oxidase